MKKNYTLSVKQFKRKQKVEKIYLKFNKIEKLNKYFDEFIFESGKCCIRSRNFYQIQAELKRPEEEILNLKDERDYLKSRYDTIQ